MKRSILAVLLAVCLVFASAALAAEKNDMSDKSDQATRGASAQADHIIKADDLAGKTVQDVNGADIGSINSIALDTATGTAYALVSVDNKLHPVPISALKKVQDKYALNIDKNKFSQSPSFSEDAMKQQMASRDFDTRVYRFFGMAPPWKATRK